MDVNSLFNLTDIIYKKDTSQVFDPLATGSKSGRGDYTDNLRYPIDLGTADKGHFVLFTIFEQEDTAFRGKAISGTSTGQNDISRILSTAGPGSTSGDGSRIVVKESKDFLKLADEGLKSTTGVSFSGSVEEGKKFLISNGGKTGENIVSFSEGVAKGTSETLNRINSITGENFLRRIRKISESIALYMPDSLLFNYSQSYNDVSMYQGKLGLAAVGASALSQMNGADPNKIGELVGTNMSAFLSSALNTKLGTAGSAIAASAFGGVQNPQLELLYISPQFREFQFDFMFYPRSEKEAREVYKIINSFKFHQSPEIKPGTAGYFLIPPSMFNIDFKYNGKDNPNLPKISDCVLTGISVDYAPNGWAAYEVPSKTEPGIGNTGTPVGTRMTLSFKETIIHTKATHTQGETNQRVNR
jgi:hypothetical protein